MDDHSSGTSVAGGFARPTRAVGRKDPGPKPVPPLFGLAPGGVCPAATVAGHAVRSYRTVSPLLRIVRERFNFCGTFPGVAPAGCYPAPFFRGARTFLPRTLSGLAGAVIQPTDAPDLFRPAAKVNKNRLSTNSLAQAISWGQKARYDEAMLARLLIVLATFVLGSGLSLAQERVWALDQSDAEVYLVFGVPETDDVGVSFWCTQQSGIVRLYFPDSDPKLKPGAEVNFKLEVAGKTYPFKGKTAFNEESTGTSLEAELKTTDPVFAALQTANSFAVKAGATSHVFPLGEADFPTFLDVCGKP